MAAVEAPHRSRIGQSGFTLVELTMVMVIIGLLMGAVLVGQELIKAAEVRAQARQVDALDAAVSTFRTRFNSLPGDMAVATNFMNLAVWPNLQNGDGDRKLYDADPASAYGPHPEIDEHTGDIAQFWVHLTAAELVNGAFDGSSTLGESFPEAEFNGCGIGVFTWVGGELGHQSMVAGVDHYFQIGLQSSPNPGTDDSVVTRNCIDPGQAYSLDHKIDDGFPHRGKVRAVGTSAAAGGAVSTDPGFGNFAGVWVITDLGPDILPPPLQTAALTILDAALGLFVSPAMAGDGVASMEEACEVVDSTAPGNWQVDTAVYAASVAATNCQLAIRGSF